MKKIHFKFLEVFRQKNDRKWEEKERKRTGGAASGVLAPETYAHAFGTIFFAASGAHVWACRRPNSGGIIEKKNPKINFCVLF